MNTILYFHYLGAKGICQSHSSLVVGLGELETQGLSHTPWVCREARTGFGCSLCLEQGGAARKVHGEDSDQHNCQSQLPRGGRYNYIREQLYFIRSPRGAAR